MGMASSQLLAVSDFLSFCIQYTLKEFFLIDVSVPLLKLVILLASTAPWARSSTTPLDVVWNHISFCLKESAAWSFLCMSHSSSIVRTAVFIYLFHAIWDVKHFFSDVAFHHLFFFFHQKGSSLHVQPLHRIFSSITILPYSVSYRSNLGLLCASEMGRTRPASMYLDLIYGLIIFTIFSVFFS